MPKLLFVTESPFYPDNSGGAQLSSLYLFNSLRNRGWQIELVCTAMLRATSVRQAVRHSLAHLQLPFQLSSPTVVKDDSLGYPCWRLIKRFHREPANRLAWFKQRLRDYQPDIVVGHSSPDCPLLNFAAQQGYPSFYFLRSLYNFDRGIGIPDHLHIVTNSPFTAEKTMEFTRRSHVGVVLPFLDLNQYRVTKRDRQYITFINPIPQKGVEIAIEIARRMPEQKFLFVRGKWTGFSDERLQSYLQSIHELSNVEVWEHQQDMRQVYAVTDILLVPSQFEEAFGRVIVEAQANRIPVVAAHVGGVPYSLGQGGILVAPKDEPQAYVEALRSLCGNAEVYAALSNLALQNSQRPEFDPELQVEQFIQFVESCIHTRSSSRQSLQVAVS